MPNQTRYRGRFAPSPTGQLHFGSLVAAVGSYLDARHHGGEWLVRMEDLDQTREVPGSADDILRTLEVFGFAWDGAVVYQSHRREAYRAAVDQLQQAGMLYPCCCTRREIALIGRMGGEGVIYPGHCRDKRNSEEDRSALRLKIDAVPMVVDDLVCGHYSQSLQQAVGDFVIQRVDGFHAYQLAVVVDDAWQGVTHIVRGADLLLSTPRQCYLQQQLGFVRPYYAHLPLVLDSDGKKLSKQSAATPVEKKRPLLALHAALATLGQRQPDKSIVSLDDFWDWAIAHWSRDQVPKTGRPVNGTP